MVNALESVRAAWSTTDEDFFRIVAELFEPAFLRGAGVLLATYDPEPADTAAEPPTAAGPAALRHADRVAAPPAAAGQVG